MRYSAYEEAIASYGKCGMKLHFDPQPATKYENMPQAREGYKLVT